MENIQHNEGQVPYNAENASKIVKNPDGFDALRKRPDIIKALPEHVALVQHPDSMKLHRIDQLPPEGKIIDVLAFCCHEDEDKLTDYDYWSESNRLDKVVVGIGIRPDDKMYLIIVTQEDITKLVSVERDDDGIVRMYGHGAKEDGSVGITALLRTSIAVELALCSVEPVRVQDGQLVACVTLEPYVP